MKKFTVRLVQLHPKEKLPVAASDWFEVEADTEDEARLKAPESEREPRFRGYHPRKELADRWDEFKDGISMTLTEFKKPGTR